MNENESGKREKKEENTQKNTTFSKNYRFRADRAQNKTKIILNAVVKART